MSQVIGPKYPNVKITLTGVDGNAFVVLGVMQKGLKKGKVPQADIDAFLKEAMSGDYANLLATCGKWATIC